MHNLTRKRVPKNFAKVIVFKAFTENLVICLLLQQTLALVLFSDAAFSSSSSSSSSSSPTPSTTTTTSSSVTVSSIQDGQDFSTTSTTTTTNRNSTQNLQQLVSHKSPLNSRQFGDMINDIQIECNSDNIVVILNTNHGFNGMIYPKGLSKNSTCMMEYHQTTSNITYYLPLRSCNTMSSDVEDGVEYFNTVMVQPHRRLVTNQGRGYHIRCRYQTKERTITNQEQQLSVNLTHSTPSVIGSATMPSCTMKIYSSQDFNKEISAENVRIGDELNLVISLDEQDVYGMLITNCLVRDGMNWGEQPLLDDNGCPIDDEIMPQFVYNKNLTRAQVTFQAHKFPYTSSVYYQCNVRLCFREGGCKHIPPNCSNQELIINNNNNNNVKKYTSNNFRSSSASSNEINSNAIVAGGSESGRRRKRWIDGGELDGLASEEILTKPNEKSIAKSMSMEVYSGLHVNDGEALLSGNDDNKPQAASLTSSSSFDGPSSIGDGDPLLMAAATDDATTNEKESSTTTTTTTTTSTNKLGKQQQTNRQSERDFCLSTRKAAIIISLISLILFVIMLIIAACLIHNKRKRKLEEQQYYQQQQYQQNLMYHNNSPYTNRAYCRD